MKKKAVCMLLGVLLTGTLLTGCGKTRQQRLPAKAHRPKRKEPEREQLILQRMTRRRLMKQRIRKQIKKQRRVQTLRKQERMLLKQKKTEKRLQYFFQMNRTGREMQKNWKYSLEEDGYDPILLYADNDSSKQVSQIQQMAAEEVSAMVIAPVDPYGLADVLADVKDAEIEIPVISYDDLIMNTDGIKYYVTFGGRQVGQMIAKQIIDSEELDKVQEAKESKTIEFFMGSLDDTQALFLYNGVMETLQPYIDDGTLICKSGKTSFDDTGILRWSSEIAKTRMTDILTEYYPDGAVPDIICTGFDDAAMGTEEALEEAGFVPGTENWPLISGAGCNEEGVRRIAEGKQTFSIFMDRRELADQCEEMVNIYLHGEDDPEVNDYEQYDNGIKIIASYFVSHSCRW